jgi:hypothetical protein
MIYISPDIISKTIPGKLLANDSYSIGVRNKIVIPYRYEDIWRHLDTTIEMFMDRHFCHDNIRCRLFLMKDKR